MDFAIDELVASYLEKRGYDTEAESLREKLTTNANENTLDPIDIAGTSKSKLASS